MLLYYHPHPKDGKGTVFTGMCLSTAGRRYTGPLVPGPFSGVGEGVPLVSGPRSFLGGGLGGTHILVLATDNVNALGGGFMCMRSTYMIAFHSNVTMTLCLFVFMLLDEKNINAQITFMGQTELTLNLIFIFKYISTMHVSCLISMTRSFLCKIHNCHFATTDVFMISLESLWIGSQSQSLQYLQRTQHSLPKKCKPKTPNPQHYKTLPT